MNRMVVKSRVGSDGVLHLALPVGVEEADKEVQITVEPITPKVTVQPALSNFGAGRPLRWAVRAACR
jgi:hypothetical protein